MTDQLYLVPGGNLSIVADRLLLDGLTVFGMQPMEALCIVFAKCNMACPGCYRGSQHADQATGLTIGAHQFPRTLVVNHLLKQMGNEGAYPGIQKIPYLTGGDPSMFISAAEAIALDFASHGIKIGFAHNGSSSKLAKKLAPFASYAAIDFKAANAQSFSNQTRIKPNKYGAYTTNFLKVIESLSAHQVFTEIRMPVFVSTSFEDLLHPATILSRIERSKHTVLIYRAQTPNIHDPRPGPDWDILTAHTKQISEHFTDIHIGCMDGFSLERRSVIFLGGIPVANCPPEISLDYSSLALRGIAYHKRTDIVRNDTPAILA